MARLESYSDALVNRLSEYEFDSFLVGARLPPDIVDREDELRAELKIRGKETLKAQVTRYLSNALSKRTGKRLDYKLPDITVLFSVSEGSIEVQPRPIWLSARYLKTERGIPQRSTICSVCRGVGCANCNFEGKTPHSIQAIITRLLKNMYRAEDCNFIWIGSEDEKSLVLGNGRPFYVEVVGPKLRHPVIDEGNLVSQSIKITEVKTLRSRPRSVPSFRIKCRVFLVRNDDIQKLPQSKREEIESIFRNSFVSVRLSRKQRVVAKKVIYLKFLNLENNQEPLLLEICCDGGIPIKKLVAGGEKDDEPIAVTPNLSQYVKGVSIDPERPFDVLEVSLLGATTNPTSQRSESKPGFEPEVPLK
jgi:tRNA pseudouridine synthase 10